MKNRRVALCKILLVGLLMFGCSTDNGSSCPEPFTGALSFEENAFSGTYVLTDIVSENPKDLTNDGIDNASTEIFAQLPDCKKDVDYEFRADRTFTVRQEYNAENCTNKLSLDGTWKYTLGQLSLINECLLQTVEIEVNNDYTEFTISDIYTFNESTGAISQSRVTLTYTKSL